MARLCCEKEKEKKKTKNEEKQGAFTVKEYKGSTV
jgi:hypothetical protein